MAFGGRGAPYHFGSAIRPATTATPASTRPSAAPWSICSRPWPTRRVTHAWGGPLGISRDWFSSVGLDGATRLAWAGGYVGDGLSTTNLAGRTLRDLILGTSSELTRLPWVNHRSPPVGARAVPFRRHQRRAPTGRRRRPGRGPEGQGHLARRRPGPPRRGLRPATRSDAGRSRPVRPCRAG